MGGPMPGESITFKGSYTLAPISPVPEAETYAMFLAGLGVLGALALRKKVSVARATS